MSNNCVLDKIQKKNCGENILPSFFVVGSHHLRIVLISDNITDLLDLKAGTSRAYDKLTGF